MQPLLTILNQTTDFLKRKGIEEARLDAQHLIAHGLGLRRLDLYLQFDRPLDEEEIARLRQLVVRRGNREPLQHIIGTTAFFNLEIGCDPRALIPRPETEQLVERALKWSATLPAGRVLEVGTGTGAPILAFAEARPEWRCAAVDLSPEAISLARENAQRNGLENRVEWLVGDLAQPAAHLAPFDLVIANLPYIPTQVIDQLQPEVRLHDPRLALDGGADGLQLVRRLLKELPPLLTPQGMLFLEVGHDQKEAMEQAIALDPSWSLLEYASDLEGIPRFPILQRKGGEQ